MAGGRGNTRTTGLEQYYTPPVVADRLVRYLVDCVQVPVERVWLEPAAGTGSFCDAFGNAGVEKVWAVDVEPYTNVASRANFLTVDLPNVDSAVCVSNPPFGRNHALSVPFFNRAASVCDVVAFIVPRSWRKWSVVNRLDRSFVKVADHDIDVSYVNEQGQQLSASRQLNTVFQVWARSSTLRVKFPHPEPPQHFQITDPVSANAALTIFGRDAGQVRTNFPRIPNTTQMFIKADDDIIDLLSRLDLAPFYKQTAYVEALSRKEVDVALEVALTGGQVAPDVLTVGSLAAPGQWLARPVGEATGPLSQHTCARCATQVAGGG